MRFHICNSTLFYQLCTSTWNEYIVVLLLIETWEKIGVGSLVPLPAPTWTGRKEKQGGVCPAPPDQSICLWSTNPTHWYAVKYTSLFTCLFGRIVCVIQKNMAVISCAIFKSVTVTLLSKVNALMMSCTGRTQMLFDCVSSCWCALVASRGVKTSLNRSTFALLYVQSPAMCRPICEVHWLSGYVIPWFNIVGWKA